jgi:hypothetical protein
VIGVARTACPLAAIGALTMGAVDGRAAASLQGWRPAPVDESLFAFDPVLASLQYDAGPLGSFRTLAPIGVVDGEPPPFGRIVEPVIGGNFSTPVASENFTVALAPELELADALETLELRIPVTLALTWGGWTLTASTAPALRDGEDEWTYGVEGSFQMTEECALSTGLMNTVGNGLSPGTLEHAASIACSVGGRWSFLGKVLTDTRDVVGEHSELVLVGVSARL